MAPRPRGSARSLATHAPALEAALFDSLEQLLFQKPAQPVKDRRATPRVRTSVVYEELNRERRAYRLTWDLSTFGLSLKAGPRYPVGTTLPIALHLPDEHSGPIAFTAEVVGTHPSTGGMRLAFRNPPGPAARRLHRFLFGSGTVARA